MIAWLQALGDARDESLAKKYQPMNGQVQRQAIFRDVMRSLPFELVVETGAHLGTTTKFLSDVAGLPVMTCEVMPRYWFYASRRLRQDPRITLIESDSRQFIADLAQDPEARARLTFFYLDAHWYNDLPLAEELELIDRNWAEWVVMIDDFQVPDDPEFGFDDYGDDRTLAVEYIPQSVMQNSVTFWPALPARTETGSRRGSVVLARRGRAAEAIRNVPSLRPDPVTR